MKNQPQTAEVKAWMVKHDILVEKWEAAGMLSTTATWGTAATQENKILMVCERTLYRRHIPILCQHICKYVDIYPYYVNTYANVPTHTNIM
jgi:hypothetical protein